VKTKASVLDLSVIKQGSDAADALRRSLELARHAEALGYARIWVAEHHNMPGIASSATAVVIGHIAGGTTRIRVGAGGVMLPNHAPLVIAEQFGTLASLYPDRIDLGLGRAPGTDQLTARALRRTLTSDSNDFPRDVVELLGYFREATPNQAVRAIPGQGLKVPVWILGSSLFGAQLAAMLGLPFGFASHFAPAALMAAIDIYRSRFEPSEQLAAPYVLAGFNVFAADDDDSAQLMRTSARQSTLNSRRGRPGPLPPPDADFENQLAPMERQMLDEHQACSAVGSPSVVHAQMQAFIERTAVDELMISAAIYDHEARLRSYEIAAHCLDAINAAAPHGLAESASTLSTQTA
jgi:luciferase family oxidoreductase group 1